MVVAITRLASTRLAPWPSPRRQQSIESLFYRYPTIYHAQAAAGRLIRDGVDVNVGAVDAKSIEGGEAMPSSEQ